MYTPKRDTKKLIKTASNRPSGYLKDVAEHSNYFDEKHYYITEANFYKLRDKYSKLKEFDIPSREDIIKELNEILDSPLLSSTRMIIGTKNSWEHFNQTNPNKAIQVQNRLIWVTDDIWYVKQSEDNSFENEVEKYLLDNKTINMDWVPDNHDLDKLSFIPLNPNEIRIPIKTQRTDNPPAKQPPSFWGKVVSYWTAISGPKVSEEVFKERKSQCLEKGGYTWAPQDGVVKKIEDNKVYLSDELVVELPEDEVPSVKEGESISRGQIIATGETKKPCQLLKVIDGENYCGACGCGVRTKAELDTKLYYQNVRCPRIPPLFTEVTIEKEPTTS